MNEDYNGFPYTDEPAEPETPAEAESADAAPVYSQPQETQYGYTQPQAAQSDYSQPQASYSPAGSGSAAYVQPETAAAKKKRERRGMSVAGVVALCLVCAILAAAVGSGVTYAALRRGSDSALGEALDSLVPTPVPVISTVSYSGASDETAATIYELAKQQVVGINTEIDYGYNFFGQLSSASVSGSGVIITADGYILTNYHVVEDAQQGDYPVEVMMYDETTYDAEIIGFDEDNDLALLKIDAEGLSAAQLGSSDDLVVGQTVYAVGNPLGELSYSMTSGIVSATNRTLTTESNVAVNMFQIDAAVNSGNSGGPVYNAAGQVVGIVTAKYSSTGVEGLGFAIPISDAAHIANQILEFGYVTDKAYLGIACRTVTSTIAEYYNMVEGAYVNTVNEDSAAEKAGLQVGDIITALDGKAVAGSSELTSMVKQYHAGDEAELTVWRGGESITLTVVFDEKLPDEESEEDAQQQPSAEQPQYGQGQYGQFYPGDMEDFFRQFFGFGY